MHRLRRLQPACPEGAIFTDFKAPPEMAQFVEDNQRFFAESLDGRDEPIGSPGGSGKVGRVGADTDRAVLDAAYGPRCRQPWRSVRAA